LGATNGCQFIGEPGRGQSARQTRAGNVAPRRQD
jgi:hypothetical protein